MTNVVCYVIRDIFLYFLQVKSFSTQTLLSLRFFIHLLKTSSFAKNPCKIVTIGQKANNLPITICKILYVYVNVSGYSPPCFFAIVTSIPSVSLCPLILHPPPSLPSAPPPLFSIPGRVFFSDVWPWGRWPRSRTARGRMVHVSEIRKSRTIQHRKFDSLKRTQSGHNTPLWK